MSTTANATSEDLYQIPENGKAEMVNGEVVQTSPTGWLPIRASGKIFRSLANHEDQQGGGYAVPDNAGFIVNLPNRNSFSPDAASGTRALPYGHEVSRRSVGVCRRGSQ